MGVVDQAVEDGVGVGRVSDHLMPFIDRDLAGENGRAAAVAFFEDLVEVSAGASVEGIKTPIVQDEELSAIEAAHDAGIASVAAGEREIDEQLWDALIKHHRLSRQAFWPRAQASQLLPTPVGPHRIRLSCASIHSPPASLWNSARSRPPAAR